MSADTTSGSGESIVPGEGADLDQVISQDERTGTLIFAGVLVVWGIFWVYMSSDLPSRQQTAHLSQGFLPITAGILLTVLSAGLFASTWFTKSRPAKELGKEPLFEPKSELRGAAVFGVLLIYILMLPIVHYLLSTFFLMATGLALARERIGLRLFLIAAVMSLLFFSIFVWGLDIALPGSSFG
jgi:hypothetical protein